MYLISKKTLKTTHPEILISIKLNESSSDGELSDILRPQLFKFVTKPPKYTSFTLCIIILARVAQPIIRSNPIYAISKRAPFCLCKHSRMIYANIRIQFHAPFGAPLNYIKQVAWRAALGWNNRLVVQPKRTHSMQVEHLVIE